MEIIRACNFNTELNIPDNPTSYSKIVVTFAQDQEIILQKQMGELTLRENSVVVSLSQDETKLFRPSQKSPMGARTGSAVYMQLRALKNNGVIGTECQKITVYDSLDDTTLSAG